MPEPGHQRHAQHIGQADAQHHPANGLRPLFRRDNLSRNQTGNAKISAVRQAGHKAEAHQPDKSRGKSTGQIAQRKRGHQPHQHDFARHAGKEHRQNRRTQHHTQSIGTDGITGLRR